MRGPSGERELDHHHRPLRRGSKTDGLRLPHPSTARARIAATWVRRFPVPLIMRPRRTDPLENGLGRRGCSERRGQTAACACRLRSVLMQIKVRAYRLFRADHSRIWESSRAARSFSSSGRQGSPAIRSRQTRSYLRLSRSLEAANASRSVRYFSGSFTADRVRASAQFCPSNSSAASSIVLTLFLTIVRFCRSLISPLFSEVPCN